MRAVFVSFGLLCGLLALSEWPGHAAAQACTFRGGFLVLHDLIPTIVGDCAGPEQVDPVSFEAEQPTIRGLLFRDWPNGLDTFTNGLRTWVRSVCGIQERPADHRFPYEVDTSEQCEGATPLLYIKPLPTRTPMPMLPPRPTPTPGPPPPPPVVFGPSDSGDDEPASARDLDCGDFEYPGGYEDAQDVLRSDEGDPDRLDGDNDGEACEHLRSRYSQES